MFVFPFNAFSPANAESCCYSSSRLSLAAVRLTIVMRNIKAHRRGKRQSKAGSTRNVSSQHHCQPNRKFSPFSYLHNTYKKNLILGPRSLHRSAKNRRKEGKGFARMETVYSLAVAPQAIVQALGFSSLKMVVSLLASVAMR